MMSIDNVLHESIRSLGTDAYKKFLDDEILFHWETLVDNTISAKVKPVAIERGIIFVHVTNSAFKDQLKFYVEEIIDTINEKLGNGAQIVKDIKLARPYQIAAFNAKEVPDERPKDFSIKSKEISLTKAEKKHCEESVKKIEDNDLRNFALQIMLAQAKFQKSQLANGWHKCQNCDSLCAETETFCEVCRVQEREKLTRILSGIFYDSPWLSSQEAQKIFLEKFPNMSGQCPIDVVNSTRATLMQQLASRLTIEEDENSNEILRLVMLERQLPPEKITPAIIRRTLSELEYNFAGSIRFRPYRFTKLNNSQRK